MCTIHSILHGSPQMLSFSVKPHLSYSHSLFFKVTPHQAHVIYPNRLNSCHLLVPLELCSALLYLALKIFAECDEIIVREPILNSRTSFSSLQRPVVLNPLASKYLLPPATLQFPGSSWQNGIPFPRFSFPSAPKHVYPLTFRSFNIK